MVRCCGEEGIKNPHRREKECGNSGMRKCVCSSPLHIVVLASQAVSPMEPDRMRLLQPFAHCRANVAGRVSNGARQSVGMFFYV